MVVVRADDVQVLHVLVDQVVELALAEDVVEAVVRHRAPALTFVRVHRARGAQRPLAGGPLAVARGVGAGLFLRGGAVVVLAEALTYILLRTPSVGLDSLSLSPLCEDAC